MYKIQFHEGDELLSWWHFREWTVEQNRVLFCCSSSEMRTGEFNVHGAGIPDIHYAIWNMHITLLWLLHHSYITSFHWIHAIYLSWCWWCSLWQKYSPRLCLSQNNKFLYIMHTMTWGHREPWHLLIWNWLMSPWSILCMAADDL